VQVEGRIIGHIEAGRLVVAESGVVIGNVTATTARIYGTLNGSVHGGTITLTATAKVTGDVHHDVLAIEAGGLLEGLARRRVARPAKLAAPVMAPEEPAETQQTAE
jgi:cytoskeletal protein CcmA (bactofilin family)